MERLLAEQMMEKARTHILFGKAAGAIRYSSLKKGGKGRACVLGCSGNERDRPIEGNAYARLPR